MQTISGMVFSDQLQYLRTGHCTQFLAHIAGQPLVNPLPELDMVMMLLCRQLALHMAHAYQHLNIDIIQCNEALAKRESGMNDTQEEALLIKFPPAENIFLDTPLVVMDLV
ncbi:hypothetical protein F4604DRAFT_1679615 [Suillus subluteus]|nr:hypothetical protein F4604DRAFT_1679615 [Suillus subluteus]